ncbi:MAG TPA: AIR synthase related protein, partial [Patescibacteria group bacterium]|nr:AIR synthase related protein [Patescibacteria group bacterium]
GDLAHVQEGLGTKNLVADAMYELTGECHYDKIAQDTVAMIVNDLITVGALPMTVAMHLAVGSSDWFDDVPRWQYLIRGWAKACELARCVWSCGETPTLRDVIMPGRACLDGSAIGYIPTSRKPFDGSRIREHDAIIFLRSNGIHANGLTMARKIAAKLPDGYLTRLSDGRTYGESLLDPTHIYVPAVEDCLTAGVDIHYAVNVTGHGLRKLMRAKEPFAYVIDLLPEPQPIFGFMQEHGPVDDAEAYGNLNMGAGFALFIPRSDINKAWNALNPEGQPRRFEPLLAGRVEKSDVKKVVLEPKNLVFTAETLQVR